MDYRPAVIPGWYEPDVDDENTDSDIEQGTETVNQLYEQSLTYREVFERFYRRNFLVISAIQWFVLLILLIKILKSK